MPGQAIYFFSLLGLLTGMVWAKVFLGRILEQRSETARAAIAILIYLAYGVLPAQFHHRP